MYTIKDEMSFDPTGMSCFRIAYATYVKIVDSGLYFIFLISFYFTFLFLFLFILYF